MEKMPFLYTMIRGAVGRRFVVKHYKGGRVVVTRFPDMGGIVATSKQRVRRDLFREAVVFARWVIGDEGRKLAFRGLLPRKKRRKVYQAALQLYMQQKGSKRWVRKVVGQLAPDSYREGNGQLARGVNGEWSMVNEVYKKLGPWRVLWRKGGERTSENTIQMREVVGLRYGEGRAWARGRPEEA